MGRDEGSEPCSLGDGTVIAETDKAIKFLSGDEDESFWVPKSVIHDDSRVWRKDDEGELIVKTWWAEKNERT